MNAHDLNDEIESNRINDENTKLKELNAFVSNNNFESFFLFLYMVNSFSKIIDLMEDTMRMKVDEVLERDQTLSQLDARVGKFYLLFSYKKFDYKKSVFILIKTHWKLELHNSNKVLER